MCILSSTFYLLLIWFFDARTMIPIYTFFFFFSYKITIKHLITKRNKLCVSLSNILLELGTYHFLKVIFRFIQFSLFEQ